MTDARTVEAAFTIDSWEPTPYDEASTGPALHRVRLAKTYRGVIEGSSVAEVLTSQASDGSGGYVASERVVGRFEGRDGSFVIQHGGLADAEGNQSTFGSIVPGSATGELAGLSGEAFEAQQGVLTLRVAVA